MKLFLLYQRALLSALWINFKVEENNCYTGKRFAYLFFLLAHLEAQNLKLPVKLGAC